MSKWWEQDKFLSPSREDWIECWIQRVFALNTLNHNIPSIQRRYWNGHIDEENLEIFHQFFINELNAKLVIYETISNSHVWQYVWEKGFINFTFDISTSGKSNSGSLNLYTNSERDLDAIEKICDEHFKNLFDDEPGTIYVLGLGANGLRLFELGYAGIAFEKENYDSAISDDFDYIVEELESETPTGRLVLLGGPPGTGKTYFLRGLVNQVKKAIFVFIPAQMVSQLSDPSFIPTLLETAEQEEDGTIILIVEDADSILVERKADNMGSISALLNFTSGLLGDMIDIRVIATTNARRMEIDEAIMRDGRLSKHVTIKDITPEHAQKVFTRLTGKDNLVYDGSPRLGQVYKTAREHGWVPPKIDKKIDRIKESRAVAKKYRIASWKDILEV